MAIETKKLTTKQLLTKMSTNLRMTLDEISKRKDSEMMEKTMHRLEIRNRQISRDINILTALMRIN
ncbi:MAG: hypothetical protein ACXAE3_01905 [Candidatus Kariarchaeaceae archaeon]|jgi:hypothetical protein